jgi:protease-4
MSSFLSFVGRGFRGLWWLLDASRRTFLNLLFLALLAALAWALLRGASPPLLQPRTALVLDIKGPISEQRAGSTRSAALLRVQGEGDEQARLRDLLAVLDAAAKDPDISHAVLALDGLGSAGLPTLHEVAAALERFKAAGKPVVAWGAGFDQRSYYLAAHASEVWLHPMGSVNVEGYGRQRSYYKDLLDRVGVTANVVRAGKFKNAAETFAANAPSPETQAADAALYGALWANWTGGVEKARKQPGGSVMQAVDSLPGSLVAVGGDAARWALERHWVDALKTRDEMRAALIQRGAPADAGPDGEQARTFRQIHWADYLARIKPASTGDAVGVVVAEGGITDGRAGPGSIGGLSTAELVRRARDNPRIKALVLRVNSPGGSAFGSELVRRELELTRQAGKPVVVSMGDVAASGGYWISMAADTVIADAATVTGSIGVIAMLPTAQGSFDKLGVHTSGYSTTWLGKAYDVRTGIEPRFVQLVQSSVDHVYADFIARVATARKTTVPKIDAVAQGRVWSGQDALAQGLVDRLGGYGDALDTAARLGKLAAGYRVDYVEAPPGRLDLWLQRFGVTTDLALAERPAGVNAVLTALGLLPPAAATLVQDLGWLAEMAEQRTPFTAAAHCLCAVP